MAIKQQPMKNKTVIITGANGNLGSAVTAHFLQQGYRVIATVFNEAAKEAVTEHPDLFVEAVDLTDEEMAIRFIRQSIIRFGRIDAALMLVGGFAAGNLSATPGNEIDKQISLNFKTAYHIARPLFGHMQENNNGRLVFIGARPATDADAGKDLLAYALGKSLLFRLAEYLNAEAKGKNITASVIVPSTLDTPLNRKNLPRIDPEDLVNPANLAEVMEFIVSEKGRALRENVVKVYANC
jgi:NAD(P)-dependent dehydrogenase (short-subunit alcohol dehydrogenase family)